MPVCGHLVSICNIPVIVDELIARYLEDPLLKDESVLKKFKKVVLMRISSVLQQRFADRIVAIMVSGSDEALAVGGMILPVFQEVE